MSQPLTLHCYAMISRQGLDNGKQVMEEKTTEEDAARLLTCSTTSLLEDGTLDEDDDNDTQGSISAADLALIEVRARAGEPGVTCGRASGRGYGGR